MLIPENRKKLYELQEDFLLEMDKLAFFVGEI